MIESGMDDLNFIRDRLTSRLNKKANECPGSYDLGHHRGYDCFLIPPSQYFSVDSNPAYP